ncbi:HD-GYP domain-containing protein, partial [Nocardioides sp.]|uniref:HD-GYP domain-containing protein n=1 Tax=Nocardioides sp. TaxID=35761 RepID=UPI0027354311
MFRLLGLLGGLSVAADLGTGAPLEESLRRCLVAVRLARLAGLPEAEVSAALYTSLLQHLGCTAYSHESARRWGDDVSSTRLAFRTDFSRPTDIWRTWVPGLAELSGTSRGRALVTTLRHGRGADAEGPPATCEVARDAAVLLGLPGTVQDALFHGLAMWNGKGYPRVAGDRIPLASRIMHVASTAVMFTLDSGPAAARTQVCAREGTQLDPGLVRLFLDHDDDLLQGVGEVDAHRAVLDVEPDPVRLVDDTCLVEVARTLGHLADLKSPWLQGHSAAVAALAAGAAECLGLGEAVPTVLVAGHLHDLGRVGVSSRIWDKAGPLSTSETDQVRLHAYHGERIIARVPELGEVASLVGRHHERCDGSGYHRGLSA